MKSHLNLKDFQHEAVYFALTAEKSILALSTGLGKTIVAFSAFSYIKEKNPKAKLLYITNKTLIEQSKGDCHNYFNLTTLAIYEVHKSKRSKLWKESHQYDVVFTNYAQLLYSMENIEEFYDKVGADNITIVFDEAVAISGETSKINKIAKGMSKLAKNVILSTATPSKGRLEQFFQLMKILGQNIITDEEFLHRFVQYEKTYFLGIKKANKFVGRSKGKVVSVAGQKSPKIQFFFKYISKFDISKSPKFGSLSMLNHKAQVRVYTTSDYSEYIVDSIHFGTGRTEETLQLHLSTGYDIVGYKNLNKFRSLISKHMFVKSKQDVAKELPPYTSSIRYIPESTKTKNKIKQLYLDSEGSPNYASLYIATSDEESSKHRELLTMLENDFNMDEDKIVIYTPYLSILKMLKKSLTDEGYLVCAIHGEVKSSQREAEKQKFLDDHSIILINDAGNAGLNLQISANIIFYNLPITFGDYQQTAGRISRIGTKHSSLFLHYLVTESTIDQDIFECVMGQTNLVKRINPKLVEPGILIDGITSDEVDNDKIDIYIRKRIKNRKEQY